MRNVIALGLIALLLGTAAECKPADKETPKPVPSCVSASKPADMACAFQ